MQEACRSSQQIRQHQGWVIVVPEVICKQKVIFLRRYTHTPGHRSSSSMIDGETMNVGLRSLSWPERQHRFLSRPRRALSTPKEITSLSSWTTINISDQNENKENYQWVTIHFRARAIRSSLVLRRISSAPSAGNSGM